MNHYDPRVDVLITSVQQIKRDIEEVKDMLGYMASEPRTHIDRTVANIKVSLINGIVYVLDRHDFSVEMNSYIGKGIIRAAYMAVNPTSPSKSLLAEITEELTLKAWFEWNDERAREIDSDIANLMLPDRDRPPEDTVNQ